LVDLAAHIAESITDGINSTLDTVEDGIEDGKEDCFAGSTVSSSSRVTQTPAWQS